METPPTPVAIESFFDPEGLGLGLAKSGFTLLEEVDRLVNLSRRDDEPGIALGALRQLRKVINDLALANGILTRGTVTLPPTEAGAVSTISATRITPRRLAPAAPSPEALDGFSTVAAPVDLSDRPDLQSDPDSSELGAE